MFRFHRDLQEMTVIESLPLRQIPSNAIQQKELQCIGLQHYMTPLVPEVGILAHIIREVITHYRQSCGAGYESR